MGIEIIANILCGTIIGFYLLFYVGLFTSMINW